MQHQEYVTNNNQNLLKPHEVAQKLGISRSFAYLLMKRGDIPTVRLGRVVRVCPSDLEEYIKLNTRRGRSSSTIPKSSLIK